MQGPLIERLPPGAPEMASYDARAADVDHRRSLTYDFATSSEKRYARCYRRYTEWCALPTVAYQSAPDRITAEKVREFAVYMSTEARYTVQTMWHTIRALEIYAERAGVWVSMEPALAVVDSYREDLVSAGEATMPRRSRRRRRR